LKNEVFLVGLVVNGAAAAAASGFGGNIDTDAFGNSCM